MKRFTLVIFITVVTLSLWGQERKEAFTNQDWLTEYDWYLTMNDDGPFVYWHESPHGIIGKSNIPAGSTIYRRRLRKEYFSYLYQTEKEHIYMLGYGRDSTGHDSVFDVTLRENNSVMFIKDNKGYIFGGDRLGGEKIEGNSLIGIWGDPENNFEIRLVEPENYVYYLQIDKIPGFAIRAKNYLFKQLSDTVFETDSSFPDGHMRLEIKDEETLVLTPLFTLPDERGLVEPLMLHRIPREIGQL
jgi:hypothetical protein